MKLRLLDSLGNFQGERDCIIVACLRELLSQRLLTEQSVFQQAKLNNPPEQSSRTILSNNPHFSRSRRALFISRRFVSVISKMWQIIDFGFPTR